MNLSADLASESMDAVPTGLVLSAAEVKSILAQEYGLFDARVDLIPSEIATVCRVTVAEGVMAFKALPSDLVNAAEVIWQGDVMTAVHQRGLPVAELRPDRAGRATSQTTVNGRDLLVQISTWLPGKPLADLEVIDDGLLTEIGALAAHLSLVLGAAPPPPSPPTHRWELSRSKHSIDEALVAVTDPQTRDLCTRAGELFDRAVGPRLNSLPRALVHHDLHDSNLLTSMESGGRRYLSGLLDFGDLVVGVRVAELAVAAAYACRHHSDPVAALLQVASGWGEIVPLDRSEAEVLLPAAIARLGVNAAVWSSQLNTNRREYALSRATGSLQTLQILLAADINEVTELIWSRLHPVGPDRV